MATAEQLKALIRSHWSDDSEQFFTLALQVAAHEAQQGHGSLATEIREILDKGRRKRSAIPAFLDLPAEVSVLVEAEDPMESWATLVLPQHLVDRIQRISREYLQRHKLRSHGLSHRRKILLTGPPGTGKTMTAKVIAHDLKLPLMTVQVDRLVTKFMGETSAKLRQVFELVERNPAVYLFDEFDAIGGGRTMENDVGEMRRVLTALLQFIEQDRSESVIVAATNTPGLLDKALFRRFDDVLSYDYPNRGERQKLVSNTLGTFLAGSFGWTGVLKASEGLSCAEIVKSCTDALKSAILEDKEKISGAVLVQALKERKHDHHR